MHKIKKISLLCVLLTLVVFGVDVGYRVLPILKPSESFRSFFPKGRFLAKMKEPTPSWMETQIESDFSPVKQITLEAIEETYLKTRESIERNVCHYRILDNQLYKFIPRGREYTRWDTLLEKALKTLLLYAKLPDLDFLLCSMDGIPEPYVPQDFYRTENQAPILGQAKLRGTDFILLIPDQFSLSDDWYKISSEILSLNLEIPWEIKQNEAIWRGGLTDRGLPDPIGGQLDFSLRYKLCKIAAQNPLLIDAGIISSHLEPEANLFKKGGLGKKEHLLYKYQIVMDGHMCTYPGYQWRLLSTSVAFKQESDQIQWFYGAVKPYTHYVPIQNDLSDLFKQIEWAQKNDEKLREISQEGRHFALNHLLIEDNYKYLYLVLQRYAKLQDIDFKIVKKETKENEKWKCIQYRSRLQVLKSISKLRSRGSE